MNLIKFTRKLKTKKKIFIIELVIGSLFFINTHYLCIILATCLTNKFINYLIEILLHLNIVY